MPINWKTPLTSGLMKARDANGRFFTALERRPRLSMGTMGAALLAPALFDNDERGYFKTSLITTPLIAAGSMALERALPAARSEFQRMKGVFQILPQTWSLPRGRPKTPRAPAREPPSGGPVRHRK